MPVQYTVSNDSTRVAAAAACVSPGPMASQNQLAVKSSAAG